MVIITSDQRDAIFDAVRAMYTALALRPDETYHFPTGRQACEYLGYPASELDRVAPAAIESFAGVGYPFAARVVQPGDVVLDIGAGSGTDALLAALFVGPSGHVIGLDMTVAMQRKCLANAESMDLQNVEVLEGNAEEIPLPDASVDVVTSNGVINLVPDKPSVVSEIYRVLRPGGWVQISDIVLRDRASEDCLSKPELWAECIVGATTESDYLESFRAAGFTAVDTLGELDYFAASSNPATRNLAYSFGARSFTFRARKPD